MKQTFYSVLIFSLFYLLLGFGCSKSGRRNTASKQDGETLSERTSPKFTPSPVNTPQIRQNKTVVKMNKTGGVYEIPTEINGVAMHFIFDTGAGLISISDNEIKLLQKQGKFSPDDIIGKGNFVDANGNITEGTIINLKTVKIGDLVLDNVEASVVHNLKAPLLMGQSALEKFGKISIDYKKAEITFE